MAFGYVKREHEYAKEENAAAEALMRHRDLLAGSDEIMAGTSFGNAHVEDIRQVEDAYHVLFAKPMRPYEPTRAEKMRWPASEM